MATDTTDTTLTDEQRKRQALASLFSGTGIGDALSNYMSATTDQAKNSLMGTGNTMGPDQTPGPVAPTQTNDNSNQNNTISQPTNNVQQMDLSNQQQVQAQPNQQLTPEQQQQLQQQLNPGMNLGTTGQPQVGNVPSVQLPQPGPGTQVASTNQQPIPTQGPVQPTAIPSVANTPALPGQVSQTGDVPSLPQNTQIAGANLAGTQGPNSTIPEAPTTPAATAPDWHSKLTSNNSKDLIDVMQDPKAPEDVKSEASDRMYNQLNDQRLNKQAQQVVNGALNGNRKDVSDLTKELNKNSTEGSYVKAYLYSRLGLNDLAKEEQEKLGAGTTYGSYLMNGDHYTVKVGSDGAVQKAFDSNGKQVNDKTLNQINSNYVAGKGTSYTGGTKIYTIPKGDPNEGQEYTSRFDNKTGRFENIITTGPNAGSVYSGSPGLEKRVQTAEEINANRVATQTQANKERIDYRLQQNLRFAGPMAYTRAGASYVGKYNAENGTSLGYNREGVLVDHNNDSKPVTQNKDGSISAVQRVEQPTTPQTTQQTNPQTTGQNQPGQNVPGQPPAFNPALSPLQNKEAQQNWAAENKKILTDFSPGGTAGKQLIAINTATNHINDDFEPLVAKMQNGQYPSANELKNKVSTWSGGSDVTNIQLVGHAMADEISKTLTSGGPGALADRESMEKRFNAAQSPEQLMDAIKYAKRLMAGKTESLGDQYARTGRTDFYTNLAPDPRVKEVVDQIRAERNARAGKNPEGTTKSGIKFKVVNNAD